MKISDFLLPAQIMIDVKASDKGRLLEQLSTEAAAQTGLAADEVVRASQASGRHSRCSPASGTASTSTPSTASQWTSSFCC